MHTFMKEKRKKEKKKTFFLLCICGPFCFAAMCFSMPKCIHPMVAWFVKRVGRCDAEGTKAVAATSPLLILLCVFIIIFYFYLFFFSFISFFFP